LKQSPTRSPSLEEVVVIALAAQRVARAISTDDVSRPLRDALDRWAGNGTGFRSTLTRLIACPVCTGWWASFAVSSVWSGRMRIRRGLSVAGAQVLLALVERLVSEQGRASVHSADMEARQSELLAQQ
jgi:hypothetical protein